MAYSADTFVADEQPTTAKWNKLWSNDASFNDGSGLNNISNPIVANSANHLVLTPGTNKYVKIAVQRQDNTTNSYKNNSIFLTGWGVIAGSVASTLQEGVTFGTTFDQRPIVVCSAGGDETTNSSTYGAGGNTIQGFTSGKAHSITTSGYTQHVGAAGNWAVGNGIYYQWLAIGELA